MSDLAVASPNLDRESSPDSRSERRHRRASKTFRAELLSRVVAIVIRLLAIPLSIQMLGTERYGLWLTVNAILMWLNLSQFGLGGGLLNEIGSASARSDHGLMRRQIATAYAMLAGASVLVFGLILAVLQTPLAPLILGVAKSPHLAREAQAGFLLAGALFAASLVINSVGSVSRGLQEGHLLAHSFTAGSILSLFSVLLVYRLQGGLLAFIAAMSLPVLVTNAVLTAYTFGWRHPQLRPSWRDVNRGSLRSLMSLGGALGLAQLGEMTVLNMASPLIADRLGLGLVAHYGVPFSMFLMAASVAQSLVSAYQAAFCEAFARGEWDWIRTTFARARLRGLLLIAAVSAGFATLGPWAIRWWTSGRIAPDHTLLTAMGAYFILMVLSMQNGILMISIGHAGIKAALQLFVAAAHIAGFLALAGNLGLLGLPIAGGIAFAVDVAVSSFVIRKRIHAGQVVAEGAA